MKGRIHHLKKMITLKKGKVNDIPSGEVSKNIKEKENESEDLDPNSNLNSQRNQEADTPAESASPLDPQAAMDKIVNDPWNQFIFEVAFIRDYFVNKAIKSGNQEYLNFKQFEGQYQLDLEHKQPFFKNPAIINFLKSKIIY